MKRCDSYAFQFTVAVAAKLCRTESVLQDESTLQTMRKDEARRAYSEEAGHKKRRNANAEECLRVTTQLCTRNAPSLASGRRGETAARP